MEASEAFRLRSSQPPMDMFRRFIEYSELSSFGGMGNTLLPEHIALRDDPRMDLLLRKITRTGASKAPMTGSNGLNWKMPT